MTPEELKRDYEIVNILNTKEGDWIKESNWTGKFCVYCDLLGYTCGLIKCKCDKDEIYKKKTITLESINQKLTQIADDYQKNNDRINKEHARILDELEQLKKETNLTDDIERAVEDFQNKKINDNIKEHDADYDENDHIKYIKKEVKK